METLTKKVEQNVSVIGETYKNAISTCLTILQLE